MLHPSVACLWCITPLPVPPLTLAQVVRRPDGKRPPLTNIAELTAGLLSHVDLDATDVTAALFLASAAQNRRRRLRIAKALLPVYKAIRSGAAGSGGGGSEEPLSSGEDGGWAGGGLRRATGWACVEI